MSILKELIKQYCSDGVEYRKIGEICDTCTDYTAAGSFADIAKNVKYNASPDYALLVRTMDIKSKFTKGQPVYINEHAFKYLWRVRLDKPCIVMPNIGNCGEIYYITPENIPYKNSSLAPNAILLNTSTENLKYISYTLQSDEFQKKLRKIVSPVGQTKFNKTELKQLEIPVPPLPVQEEIVRILDKMTELETELETELDLRKKQYEYYRDILFSSTKTEIKYLTDISKNLDKMRKPITSGNRIAGDIPYYGASGVVDHVKGYIFDGTYLCISEDGANLLARVTPIAFTITGKSWVNNHAHILEFENDNVRKYVEYYLNSVDLSKFITGGAQPKLNQDNMNKIPIPMPDQNEIDRIVGVLDKFSTLTADLSEGLPAEIKMRHQQFLFYRDKLLSFE